jgi:hypothetical protein
LTVTLLPAATAVGVEPSISPAPTAPFGRSNTSGAVCTGRAPALTIGRM